MPRPFVDTGEVDRTPRRLLLLTYHFPPSRAVGGVRWQQMGRFAAEHGWGLDVVCLDPASLDAPDTERLGDLPPALRAYGVPAVDESRYGPLVRTAIRTRRSVTAREGVERPGGPAPAAILHERAVAREDALARSTWNPSTWPRTLLTLHFLSMSHEWARRAAELGRRIAGPAHRAVVSSGPPHEVHAAARRLARTLALPLIPDFRDPWSLNERVPTGWGTRLYFDRAARDEAHVMADAAFVVVNTEPAARALAAEHPRHATKIHVVMNGSDDEGREAGAAPSAGPLVVAYAGAVYAGRDPGALFRAAARVIAAMGLTPDDLRFEFAGPVDAACPPVDAVAAAAGIAPFVSYLGSLTRSETARLLSKAHLLVSLPQEEDTAVPSKIFEYAAHPAWMLVLAGPASASAGVLVGTEAAVVEPHDEEGIAAVLAARLEAHRRGERPLPVGRDGRFSRRRQAERFLDLLERVVAPSV